MPAKPKKRATPYAKKMHKYRSRPQTGKSNLTRDRKRNAKSPGWRIAKSGKPYFERRKNRSDAGKKRI